MTRTAQRLGVSQPSVSRALGQLRILLADPILVRSHGRMEMTHRAEELAKPLEGWLSLTSSLLNPAGFAPAELDRGFHVASTDFGVLSVISPALSLILKRAPSARIDVAPFSGDMMKKLAMGDLDLIVTGFQPDQSLTHARHLFRETQSCVMRAGHPLSTGPSHQPMSLEDYFTWSHIGIAVGEPGIDYPQACLGERAGQRNVIARVPYFYAAPDLLGSSDAILTMPSRAAARFAATHGFSCRPAPEEIDGFDYWVLWHERSARDAAIHWLVDVLAEACAEPAAADRLAHCNIDVVNP